MEGQKESRKVKVLERKGRAVKLEVEGEDHTLLAPLTSKLLENEGVEIASYSIKHTLVSNPVLFVKMREGKESGDAVEAVKSAAASLASEFEEFARLYKKAAIV